MPKIAVAGRGAPWGLVDLMGAGWLKMEENGVKWGIKQA